MSVLQFSGKCFAHSIAAYPGAYFSWRSSITHIPGAHEYRDVVMLILPHLVTNVLNQLTKVLSCLRELQCVHYSNTDYLRSN